MLHMEQKDYKLEIILELLKNEKHLRFLAKSIRVNHMNISRKLKKLLSKNIVDFKQEGKNKVYFLKKTPEARAHVYIAESYKLIKIIEKYPTMRNIIEKIQKNPKINLAVLFGSYAKGIAKKESDIDVYINTTDKKLKKEIEIINTRLSIKIGSYDRSNLLIKEIEKNHVIIKGIEDYYEKNKFCQTTKTPTGTTGCSSGCLYFLVPERKNKYFIYLSGKHSKATISSL